MKRVLSIIIFTILIVLINYSNISNAANDLSIKAENDKILKEQNFKLYINLSGNTNIAAYTLNLYYDKEKVEFIKSDNENTNVIENKIVSIWYDETGGNKEKTNQQIAEYEFKAINIGEALFSITGEFYDKEGNELNLNNSFTKINISEKVEEKMVINEGEDNNSLLKILRLNQEGIIPEFSPEIKEYYFNTNLNINELEVTAIPEATNAKVNITGNKNLTKGLNKISIEVTSRDGTSKSVYNINVTKTDDIRNANANLEMLAIENTLLEPIFDVSILNYKASVPSEIDNLNIFAVPENINAKVEIINGNNLKEGDNTVTVKVTAPNGFTIKKYEIIVHKRTSEEDKKVEEERKLEVEKLGNILKEQDKEKESNKNENKEEKINELDVFRVVFGILIVIIFIIPLIRIIKNNHER